MYKKLLIISLALVVSLFAEAKMYGLFYGIDGDNLGCPENDVADLAELYRKNGGQVILVRGDGVTRSNVLEGLRKQADACSPEDIIMFVYSGHGNNGYIQCGKQSVSFREVKSILSTCQARRKVVIIDACYSGSFVDQRNGTLAGENVIVLTSARKNEESYEAEGARNSHLFTALLDGLKGKADANNDGMVVAKELYDYLNNNTNKFIIMQHPTMKGRFNENTILYTYSKKPVAANIKPSAPLPGVASTTIKDEGKSGSVKEILIGYAKSIWHWINWWKALLSVFIFIVVIALFKYFIAYKLLMKYL